MRWLGAVRIAVLPDLAGHSRASKATAAVSQRGVSLLRCTSGVSLLSIFLMTKTELAACLPRGTPSRDSWPA